MLLNVKIIHFTVKILRFIEFLVFHRKNAIKISVRR